MNTAETLMLFRSSLVIDTKLSGQIGRKFNDFISKWVSFSKTYGMNDLLGAVFNVGQLGGGEAENLIVAVEVQKLETES